MLKLVIDVNTAEDLADILDAFFIIDEGLIMSQVYMSIEFCLKKGNKPLLTENP